MPATTASGTRRLPRARITATATPSTSASTPATRRTTIRSPERVTSTSSNEDVPHTANQPAMAQPPVETSIDVVLTKRNIPHTSRHADDGSSSAAPERTHRV